MLIVAGQDNQKSHESYTCYFIIHSICFSKLYVSQYYKYVSPSERCPTQPESPQVFQAGGEREGRRLDGGRHRVPQEEESQGKQPVDQVRRE